VTLHDAIFMPWWGVGSVSDAFGSGLDEFGPELAIRWETERLSTANHVADGMGDCHPSRPIRQSVALGMRLRSPPEPDSRNARVIASAGIVSGLTLK